MNQCFVAKESVTPSSVITATPLKQTEAKTVGNRSPMKTPEPMMNLNDFGNDSTPHKVKLVRCFKHNQSHFLL